MNMNMKKKTILTLLTAILLLIAGKANAAEPQLKTMKFGSEERSYWLYLPDNLQEGAPLVIMLHGYGGKADNYRPEMRAVADREGFALCIPQGEKDTKGKTGWIVGYPPQKDIKRDDARFIIALKKKLQKEYSLSKKNAFLTGMSNGGEMCYLMAFLHPDAFSAYAPIAGLTMQWIYKDYRPKKAVPLMEVHGTADRTSFWEGDPGNTGGWGEYISVPAAVGKWVSEARCTHEVTEELPLLKEDSHKVILHRYAGCDEAWKGGPEIQVRLYEVVGGKHSWALGDMDTCSAVWEFFSLYLR